MFMNNSQSPVIVALDFDNQLSALALAERLDPTQCRLKVGKELFTRAGPELVKTLVAMDFDVFLDLKFHDIPNTTAKAVSAAADLGVWMTNVHASGGSRMMSAASKMGSKFVVGNFPCLAKGMRSSLSTSGKSRSYSWSAIVGFGA